MRHTYSLYVLALLASVAATPLLAQAPTTTTTTDAAAALPTGESSASTPLAEEVVVTGSRIARTGVTATTPVVVLGSQDIVQAGAVASGDLLRQLPAVAPGLGAESAGVSFNGAGLDLVDLRALGTNRTLVLVNGRRQVGSNPSTTSVDLNTIPTPLIERFEVITGGASAVYGADAVSGVLNVILKQDFEGLQFDGQFGTSQRGDARRYAISALAGGNFADGRGNVTAFAGYTREGGIAYDARRRAINGRNYIANPASRNSADGVPDWIIVDNVRQIGGQRESAFILGGRAYAFNADGSVRNFGLGPSGLIGGGQFTDGGEAELGYDGQCPQAKCALRIPVQRVLISGTANYEVSPAINLFVEGRFAKTESQARFGSVFEIPPNTNRIAITNPFVSPSLAALMTANNVTSIGILRSDQELGLRGQDTDRNVYQLTGGSKGALGFGDWKYDASVQYGETRFTNTRINDVDQQRFLNALDAFRDTDGVIKCRLDTARAAGCVPINFLQTGAAISQAALNYIKIPFATETANLSQFVSTANVTGSVGDLWGAGNISVALGAEYRREKSVYNVSSVDAAGQGFFFTRRLSTAGQFDVLEGYAETIVPILTDVPFFRRLEVEAAVRISDYSTSGRTTSWKYGGSWAPTTDIRFRAIKARAVRAPNVGELFSPGSEGFLTVDDPCDVNFRNRTPSRAANCAALGIPAGYVSNARTINIRTATSGNPSLDVEKADTLTLGAVLTPSFLPGFSATVDYFDIKIKDAINVFAAQDILNNCVDVGSTANPFCDSITRAPGGDLQQIRRQNINVSRLVREGIDAELRYRQDIGDLGILNFSLVGTHMFKVTTVVAPGTLTGGTTIDFNGEFGYPKWKGRFSTNWSLDRFDLTATVTYFSNMTREVQPASAEDNRADYGSGNYFLVNMQGGFDVTEKLRFFVGIDNVLDRKPPNLPDTRAGGAGSYAGVEIFPITGRYFYTGARVGF